MRFRDIARQGFVAGTWLTLFSVFLQVLLAGLGIFSDAGFFFWHAEVNAVAVFGLPLLLLLVGWAARAPRRVMWLLAAIAGLVVLQSLLLVPYHLRATGLLRAVSGLHAVNALVIFWVAIDVLERTRRWSAAASAA